MGMGLLMSGLGALGKSVASSAEAYQKSKDEQDAADKKTKAAGDLADKNNLAASDLVRQRIALEEEKDNRVREANAAPLKRFGESVSRFSQEDIPGTLTQPEGRSSRSGLSISPAVSPSGSWDQINASNMTTQPARNAEQLALLKAELVKETDPENIAALRRDINRVGELPLPDAEQPVDQSIATKGLLGATRRRTSDEAMAAARDEMIAKGDLQAVEAADKANAVNVAGKRQKAQDEYSHRREDRLDRFAESQAENNDKKYTLAELKEQRAATSKSLDGVNADIRSLEKEAANPMLMPQQKDVIDRQLTSARNEAKIYRLSLAGAGLDAPDNKESGNAPPDGTRLKKDGKIYVVKNGVPVAESGENKATTPAPTAEQKRKPVLGEEGFGPGRESRSPINTRYLPIARGKTKQQYQNPSTGVWYDTQDEAIQSLKK